jgi:predicted enzyme related to lactoylglutathione lyase
MPERRTDPLDALRAPVTPSTPDPAFAADLRDRLVRALLAPRPKEPSMATDLTTRPRHGSRHGDVSTISLALPDLERGRAFYNAVLGWRYTPDSDGNDAEVEDIVPSTRLRATEEPSAARGRRAVLGFRVDAIDAAVAAVRAHGGTITDPHPAASGPTAEGRDDQGIPFSLHEMPATPDTPGRGEFSNGEVQGDVSYLTMVVPDVGAAHVFYGGVFGWTFNIGRAGGAQVDGVAPQIGMTTRPESGAATPGVILCYRVDDIEAAVARVRGAGGRARDVAERPYGRESLCTDDQDTPFYLHQF